MSFDPASYQQNADHLCGASCVRMILHHFNLSVAAERTLGIKLRARFETGIEPFQIQTYLTSQGFEVDNRGHGKPLRDCTIKCFNRLVSFFKEGWVPIICWMDWDGHYCIVENITSRSIRLADPAAKYDNRPDGYTETTIDRFKAMWRTPHTRQLHEALFVRKHVPL
jgi:ABC-type bacteriocin/lantibiotic exporter with double-glycine peptidase domain